MKFLTPYAFAQDLRPMMLQFLPTWGEVHFRGKRTDRGVSSVLPPLLRGTCGADQPTPSRVTAGVWKSDESSFPLYVSYKSEVESMFSAEQRQRHDSAIQKALQGELSIYSALQAVVPFEITLSARAFMAVRLAEFYWQDLGEKALKEFKTVWSARFLGQEHEPLKYGLPLYYGITARRFKRALSVHKHLHIPLGNAFTFSCKAVAVVPESMGTEALEKTLDILTSPPSRQPWWFKREIRRTVHEVFRSRPFRAPSRFLIPSERGHYDSSRGQGGALHSLIWEQRRRQYGTVTYAIHRGSVRGDLVKMLEHRGTVCEIYDERSIVIDCFLGAYEDRTVDMGLGYVKPSAVFESLKVRVVTAAEAHLQHLGRYVQKQWWSVLSAHPVFLATGRPVTDQDISKFYCNCPESSKIISGDFEAATNNLESWASEETIDAIADETSMDARYRNLCHRVSVGCQLTGFPSQKGRVKAKSNPPRMQMTKGSLMGGVVNFILLCLINATVCRRAMEVTYQRSFTLVQTGMLINGDDCLLHVPNDNSAYRVWQEMTKTVGLKLSIGKNYISDRFMVINSRMYVPNSPVQTWMSGSFVRRVPFVNPGHLFAMSRVQSNDTEEEQMTGFLARCQKLIDDNCGGDRDSLIDLWIYLNANKLKEISCPKQSWFLPRYCGGFGLPRPSGLEISSCSMEARKLAMYICNFDGQALELSMALENPARKTYVSEGLRCVAQAQDRLGIKCTLVPEYSDEWHNRDQVSSGFAGFCAQDGASESYLSENFSKALNRAKNTAPCQDFPYWDRVFVRPGIELPGIDVSFEMECIWGQAESNSTVVDRQLVASVPLSAPVSWDYVIDYIHAKENSLNRSANYRFRKDPRRLNAARMRIAMDLDYFYDAIDRKYLSATKLLEWAQQL